MANAGKWYFVGISKDIFGISLMFLVFPGNSRYFLGVIPQCATLVKSLIYSATRYVAGKYESEK